MLEGLFAMTVARHFAEDMPLTHFQRQAHCSCIHRRLYRRAVLGVAQGGRSQTIRHFIGRRSLPIQFVPNSLYTLQSSS